MRRIDHYIGRVQNEQVPASPAGPSTIDMKTLRDWLDAGKPIRILDVRPAAERSEWSIPGSMHVDAYDALRSHDPHALDAVQLPFDAPIVTVCAAGKTSLLAAEVLRERGHAVFSLELDMAGWTHAWNTAEVTVALPDLRVIQVRRTGKGCLSYIVAAAGSAVVIDPSVQPEVYLETAGREGWTITGIIDTHVHADHLSRSLSLARVTGALVRLPEQRRVSFAHVPVREGDAVPLGSSGRFLTALHTPGHTGESTCFSLEGAALFTGDTLFLNGVGRPDLEGGQAEAEPRGRQLYTSLRRLLSFPPRTLVLPSHTGSPVAFDGIAILATLGEVEARIAALSKEEGFVAWVLANIPKTPPNHALIISLNETGQIPEGELTRLEAGANRCAIA